MSKEEWKTVRKYWLTLTTVLPKQEHGNKIDYINRCVFESKEVTGDEIDEEAVSLTTMTQLMNEIDNETKANTVNNNDNNNNNNKVDQETQELSQNITQFICNPFSKMADFKEKENFDYKLNMFKQFCQENKTGGIFRCSKLELASFEDEEIRNKYELLWHDFVSIRINLFEIKLRNLFEKQLNVSTSKVDEFYQFINYYRSLCVMLPINSDSEIILFEKTFDQWCEMTKKFNDNDNSNNNNNVKFKLNPIFQFIIIWHGIFVLLHKKVTYLRGDATKSGFSGESVGPSRSHGLGVKIERYLFPNHFKKTRIWKDMNTYDYQYEIHAKKSYVEEQKKIVEKSLSDLKSDNNNSNKKSTLCQLTREYIIDQFCQTNMFGNYVNSNGFEPNYGGLTYDDVPASEIYSIEEKEQKELDENNEKVLKLCRKVLFDNNYDELDKLIEYSISNITDISSYEINMHMSFFEESCNDSGILCFMTNELAYAVFHDLTIDSLENKGDDEDDGVLLFPKLLPMFKFLYNFSCYVYCYPCKSSKSLKKTNESIYVSNYFDLKDTLYQNVFEKKEQKENKEKEEKEAKEAKEENEISKKAGKIGEFNFFRSCCWKDGTLLHCATSGQYQQYCDLLVRDGSNIHVYNRLNSKSRMTPHQICEESNNSKLKLIFQVWSFFCCFVAGGVVTVCAVFRLLFCFWIVFFWFFFGFFGFFIGLTPKNATQRDRLDDDRSEDNVMSNMKTIEDSSNIFMQQTMFAKYFLKCLNINVNDEVEMENKKHSLITEVWRKVHYHHRDFMTNELYRNINDFDGLLTLKDKKEGIKVMDNILAVILRLFETKMLIRDDLLVLCWQYCSNYDSNNKSSKDSSGDKTSLFLDSLIKCVSDCFVKENKYYNRDYLYFKHFLLNSSIWYCKNYLNNKLLFSYIDDLADKLLLKQKEYIWKCISDESQNDNENWTNLCNFSKYNNDNGDTILRQDEIKNGIKSIKSVKEIYCINADMDEHNTEKDSYDMISEYNDKVYLTQCLTFAHQNNEYFQQEIYKYNFWRTKAPVKKYDRCLVKSNTDYSNETFPSSAHILG